MNRCEWIVCEHSSRWVSALRLALDRAAPAGGARYRLREVRHLSELAGELAERPASLAAIEVRRGNFADALELLTSTRQRFPHVRCVALLDRSLSDSYDEVRSALIEAGAHATATSPRRLDALISLGRRHATVVAQYAASTNENLSLTARVWTSLPWQEA